MAIKELSMARGPSLRLQIKQYGYNSEVTLLNS